jgi:hypothetical protein
MTTTPLRVLVAALALFMLTTIAGLSRAGAVERAEAATGPFAQLLGTWGGGGMASYDDGSRERLTCNAYYTGGGSQLRLAIYCNSPTHKIQMRGKVSYSGGRVTGTWEERTFNAEGSLNGSASGNRISMSIGGNVQGSMNVSYSNNRQSVSITAGGVALRGVSMSLSRR